MAGNVSEWTMEGNYTSMRIIRGSNCYSDDEYVNNRLLRSAYDAEFDGGFRPALYIK